MGYHVIIPDMGKSVYASQYYPETVKTMAMYPQLPFVLDTLLPFLQDSIHILNSSHNNFLIGYSMGARGALAIAENTENIFSRLVLISGEYDQTLVPEDNILTMYFGSYQQFPERWEGKDNLLRNIDKLNIPVLILHGQNDDVISAIQSDTLAKVLENKNKFYIKTIYNNYGHDFDFVQKTIKDVNVFLNKDFLPLN
jgi:pimeloyl-ACP methyl ester carboxylesterase